MLPFGSAPAGAWRLARPVQDVLEQVEPDAFLFTLALCERAKLDRIRLASRSPASLSVLAPCPQPHQLALEQAEGETAALAEVTGSPNSASDDADDAGGQQGHAGHSNREGDREMGARVNDVEQRPAQQQGEKQEQEDDQRDSGGHRVPRFRSSTDDRSWKADACFGTRKLLRVHATA